MTRTLFPQLSAILLLASATLLTSCDDSSSGGGSDTIDADIYGTWIQVAGFAGEANRDTAEFTDARIACDGSTLTGNGHFAKNGQIGLTLQNETSTMYEYEISGDTLYLENVFLGSTPDGTIDRSTALRYVPKGKFTAPSYAVEPSLLGNWVETGSWGDPDSLRISNDRFAHVMSSITRLEFILGEENTLYAVNGEIGEVINGKKKATYQYLLEGDTLFLEQCNACDDSGVYKYTADTFVRQVP